MVLLPDSPAPEKREKEFDFSQCLTVDVLFMLQVFAVLKKGLHRVGFVMQSIQNENTLETIFTVHGNGNAGGSSFAIKGLNG